MGQSFAWGIAASSSLLLGGGLAIWLRIGRRTLGLVMAFGAGVLVSAVAFELVQEAFEAAPGKAVRRSACSSAVSSSSPETG